MRLTRTVLMAAAAFWLREHGFINEPAFYVGLGLAYLAGTFP